MPDKAIPLERLRFFQEKVGLCEADFALLEGYKHIFAARQEDFGRAFWDYFQGIERTRLILEHDRPSRRLERTLAKWFGDLFSQDLNRRFLHGLWNSGLRHVEVNLDQRFVNLGYAMARTFCHGVIAREVPVGEREPLATVVDRLLDFCVLVATDSFVTTTTRCDRQVIAGIAHQVRNPVTVIGGNIKRLQKQVKADSQAWQAYDRVLKENMRLERMLRDVAVYTGLFQSDPLTAPVSLNGAIESTLRLMREAGSLEGVALSLELDPRLPPVMSDAAELETMFYYLLENALEAAPVRGGRVRVTTGPGALPHMAQAELVNNGQTPDPAALADLFQPFHSTKPMGTGFGLPIASAVARRHLGTLTLEPGPGEGAICQVVLPLS